MLKSQNAGSENTIRTHDLALGPISTPWKTRRISRLASALAITLLLALQTYGQGILNPPELSPTETKLYQATEISLSSDDTQATVYFTLEAEGTISPLQAYTAPFSIDKTTIVRAIARRSGFTDSATSVRTYHLVKELDAWGLGSNIAFESISENVSDAKTYGSGVSVLKSDGTVAVLQSGSSAPVNPPPPLQDVFAIEAGNEFTVALRDNGTVIAWGNDEYGKTNPPANLTGVVSVSAGYYSASALSADGRVVSWGGSASNWRNTPPRDLTDVIAVSDGPDYALGILRDGRLVAWRNGAFTNLANIPPSLTHVVAVEAGDGHNIALRADGTAVAWGSKLGNSVTTVSQWTDLTDISTSYSSSLGLKAEGTVITTANDPSIVPDPRLDQVVSLDANHYTAAAIRSSPLDQHTVQIVFDPAKGHVRKSLQKSNFKPNEALQLIAIPQPGYGFSHWTGDLQSTANPLNLRVTGNLSAEAVFLPALLPPTTDFDSSQPVHQQGSVELANPNPIGQIRYTIDGTRPTAQSPVYDGPIDSTQSIEIRAQCFADDHAPSLELISHLDITSLIGFGAPTSTLIDFPATATDIVAVAPTLTHVLALRSNGTITSWSDYRDSESEFEAALENVVAIAAGREVNIALFADGTVLSWDSELSREIAQPAGLTQVVAIAAGDSHLLALKSDGSLVSWSPWLGQADFTPETNGKAIAIACGSEHSVALLNNGTALDWDKNGLRTTPENLSQIRSVSAASDNSFALLYDGTVTTWGGNFPPRLRRVKDVVAISSSPFATYGIFSDGHLEMLFTQGPPGSEVPEDLGHITSVAAASGYVLALKSGSPSILPTRQFLPARGDSPLQLEYYIPRGRHYQILKSDDLKTWEPYTDPGQLTLSLGDRILIDLPLGETQSKFFRLVAP